MVGERASLQAFLLIFLEASAPAVVLVSLSLPGSPCPFSAPESVALPCPDPGRATARSGISAALLPLGPLCSTWPVGTPRGAKLPLGDTLAHAGPVGSWGFAGAYHNGLVLTVHRPPRTNPVPKRPQTGSLTRNDVYFTITHRHGSATRPWAHFCGPRSADGGLPRSPHKSACGSPQCGPTRTLPHTPHMPYRFFVE